MAIVRAVASGNWSAGATWNTGSVPTSADDVYSNTFTVTIDTSPTVLRVSNASATGVTAGGTFVPTNGITLTCTGAGVVTGFTSLPCITSSLTVGQSFSVVASVAGAPGSGIPGISNTSGGTVNITGAVSSGTGAGGNGVTNSSTGTVNITGDVSGVASLGNGHGVQNTSTGTVNITGACTAVNGNAYTSSSASTLSHTGTISAANGIPAISSRSTSSVVTVTGPFLTSANGTHAIDCPVWRWSSATPVSYYQVRTAVSGAIRTLFTADSVGGNPATTNVRSGTVYGPSNELTGTCAVPAAGSVALGVAVDNTTGTAVLTAANVQTALTSQGLTTTRATYLDNLDTTVSSRLASASYTTPPTVGDIATAVWNAATSALSNLGSIGKLLVDNINASISSRLAGASYQAPLDASGTRAAIGLASANLDTQLDALPTAVENASAVRTELTPELNNLDAAVSTRSTFDPATDTVSNVTLVETTTNLTNPPDVPTTTEIADAVRIELTPELDRIDVDVSSRLASVDYTTPPTSLENAQAVRTELAPELGRIDADVSSRLASVDYTTPPTALENAQAVEIQLSLPLGNMDVAVSTRSTFNPTTDTVAQVTLVDTTTDLTNPPVVPTPEQIAEAVRTELTPELDRVSNCATVSTTGQQIQNALSP